MVPLAIGALKLPPPPGGVETRNSLSVKIEHPARQAFPFCVLCCAQTVQRSTLIYSIRPHEPAVTVIQPAGCWLLLRSLGPHALDHGRLSFSTRRFQPPTTFGTSGPSIKQSKPFQRLALHPLRPVCEQARARTPPRWEDERLRSRPSRMIGIGRCKYPQSPDGCDTGPSLTPSSSRTRQQACHQPPLRDADDL